jgi:hypothetical protein
VEACFILSFVVSLEVKKEDGFILPFVVSLELKK